MFLKTLTGHFLLLTFIFVLLAEIMVLVPTMARFREDYLRERMERAQIASLALLSSPMVEITPELKDELLENAEVSSIVLRRDAMRELVLSRSNFNPVDQVVDLRKTTVVNLIIDAFDTLINGSDRTILILGEPVKGGGVLIEIILTEKPLKQAMLTYGQRILFISFVLLLILAIILFFAIRILIGQPINRVVRHIQNFQSDPEDARQIIIPKARVSEILQVEKTLEKMETQLNYSLRERKRLVALGTAISKISHDLRNILTTTQLLADRVELSDDPRIKKTAPKLIMSLGRAVNLCERTLSFGKVEEDEPKAVLMLAKEFLSDAIDSERLAITEPSIFIMLTCPDTLEIFADPEHLYRVVTNIIRNARQILSEREVGGGIHVKAYEDAKCTHIEIHDTGAGIPMKVQENIFKPFYGSMRLDSSGLGLAISWELIKNHGGMLDLVYSGDKGTCFRVSLPKKPK